MVSRPAETLSLALGEAVAAIVALLLSLGVDVPPGAVAAATALVAPIAALVTWWVARKQRDVTSTLSSAKDGTVVD